MTEEQKERIRVIAARYEELVIREEYARALNVAGLTNIERIALAQETALVEAERQEAWVELRRAQGFAV